MLEEARLLLQGAVEARMPTDGDLGITIAPPCIYSEHSE